MENAIFLKNRISKLLIVFILFALLVIFDILIIYYISGYFSEKYLWLFVGFNLFILLIISIIDYFFLLLLIFFSLPFAKSIFNFEIWIITFNLYTIGIIFFFFLSIFLVLLNKKTYSFNNIDFFILLICFYFLISILRSKDIIDAGFLAFHAIFIPVLSYFVLKIMLDNDFEYKILLHTIILSISIFGIFVFLNAIKTHQRGAAFGVPPIGSSTYLIVGLLYILYLKLYKKREFFVPFIFNILGFVSTYSRVYILAFLLTPIFRKIILKSKSFLFISVFLITTLLLTILLVFYADKFSTNVTYTSSELRSIKRLYDIKFYKWTLYNRAISYKKGLENFKNNFLFGVGLYKGNIVITQHNFHIEWLEFSGIFGYILYFLMFILFFKKSTHYVDDNYVAVSLIILISILFNSLFNGIMHGIMPYMTFIIMGLVISRINILTFNNRYL